MWYSGITIKVAAVALCSTALAQQQQAQPLFNANDPRFEDFRPSGHGDSRGPCPGLNALANHGFLPRDGRNITMRDLIRGANQGLGGAPSMLVPAGLLGVFATPSKYDNPPAIDLEDLGRNPFLEHDVSYSREDHEIGDPNPFNGTLWAQSLTELSKSSTTSPQALGRAHAIRWADQRRKNPDLSYGIKTAALGLLEGSMLSLLDPNGRPPLEWIRSIFEEERLPSHFGWRPTATSITLPKVIRMIIPAAMSDRSVTFNIMSLLMSSPSDLLRSLVQVGDGQDRAQAVQSAAQTVRELGFGEDEVQAVAAFA